jgi:SAM-dependent methyltransferase
VDNASLTSRLWSRLTRDWFCLTDPKRYREIVGERLVFHALKESGWLSGLQGSRILEIGPKHGKDSALLATLEPSELFLIDLPEKDAMVKEWLSTIPCNTRYFQGNILYLNDTDRERMGHFDLVWCLGVLYHNVEQLRLVKRLFDFCSIGGRLAIESATTRNRKLRGLNVVEIHWPRPYRDVPTITHLPSASAIKSWMEMVGFTDVAIWDIYSKRLGRDRSVLTGRKTEGSRPYVSYSASGLNPIYTVGKAE